MSDDALEVQIRLPQATLGPLQRLATRAGVPLEHLIQILLATQVPPPSEPQEPTA
jgi:hypothetical protein